MTIFEKLSAITSELSVVAKNLVVGEGRSSYKAVGEADVLAAVKPLEAKYKVYSYPYSRRVIDSDTLTVSKTYNGNTTETTKFFMRVETVYRFVNIEKPDEYVDVTTYGDGVDSNDKACGKAMTYADKYALLKAYKIITGDDPDQFKSEDAKVERSTAKIGGVEVQTHKPIVTQDNGTIGVVCENCLQIIQPKTVNGETLTAYDVAKRSYDTYGRMLCYDCAMKAKKKDSSGAVCKA